LYIDESVTDAEMAYTSTKTPRENLSVLPLKTQTKPENKAQILTLKMIGITQNFGSKR